MDRQERIDQATTKIIESVQMWSWNREITMTALEATVRCTIEALVQDLEVRR